MLVLIIFLQREEKYWYSTGFFLAGASLFMTSIVSPTFLFPLAKPNSLFFVVGSSYEIYLINCFQTKLVAIMLVLMVFYNAKRSIGILQVFLAGASLFMTSIVSPTFLFPLAKPNSLFPLPCVKKLRIYSVSPPPPSVFFMTPSYKLYVVI